MSKSPKEQKPVNFKTKYITLGIVVALLIAAIVLCIVFMGNKEAKAIMTMETNPGVQLVLDKNNKVVSQVATNADGEKLLTIVDFTGMSAEAAAELFAKASTEWGKINTVDTSSGASADGSTKVVITISAEKSEEYAKLASSVKSTVNKYFSENGIFAGAVTSVSEDVATAVNKMGVSAKEYANKTTQEILDYAKEASSDLEKIAISARDSMKTDFETLYATVIAGTDKLFEAADKSFKAAETALNDAKKALDSAKDSAQKAIQQAIYDAAKKTYDTAKADYDKAKAEFEKKRVELKKQWDVKITELEKNAEAYFKQLKIDMETAYNAAKTEIQTHIDNFNKKSDAEKQAAQDKIKLLQNSLTK